MMHVSSGHIVFWEPRGRVCAVCLGAFVATAANAIRCPACAELRAAQRMARAQARFDAKRKAAR